MIPAAQLNHLRHPEKHRAQTLSQTGGKSGYLSTGLCHGDFQKLLDDSNPDEQPGLRITILVQSFLKNKWNN